GARSLARQRRRQRTHRRVRTAARRGRCQRCGWPRRRFAPASGTLRHNADGKAVDVRPGPWRRVLRRASGAEDSPRRPAGWLPLLVAHSGNRQQCAVSDEEIVMIITKKALPRRTFLKGVQATLALPLLDAMIPAVTALANTPAKPVSRLGFVYIPMGCDRARWTPLDERGALNELSPILAPLEPVKEQLTVITNLRLEQSYPGTHDTSN